MTEIKVTVDICYHEHSGNFFMNYSNESGVIISQKLTEPIAISLAKHLGIIITK